MPDARPKREPVVKAKGRKPKREISMSAQELAAVRYSAELYYINDVIGNISLRDLSELDRFKMIKLKTLEMWAQQDRWLAQRREKQARIKQGLEERISMQLIQSQLKQIDELQKIYDRAVAFARNSTVRPKSFEQTAMVALKLSERMGNMRQDLSDKLAPPAYDQDETTQETGETKRRKLPDDVIPQIPPDEAMAAAHAIMRARRSKLLGSPDTIAAADVPEDAQVVEDVEDVE
jgi:uncharacterized FlaG/YvyC family protein